MARQLRILLLLLVLLGVAAGAWIERASIASWKTPVLVALSPINADGSPVADDYIAALQAKDLQAVADFFEEQRAEYNLPLATPIHVMLTPPVRELPPALTDRPNVLQIMWWSLRLRAWARFSAPRPPGPTPRIRLFLLYHDPASSPTLRHSIGLQKGLVGVVNLFADKNMAGSNNVVIAHELLHTLGATDKYDMADNSPLYPIGYAEPDRNPLLPQAFAEVMAGRIPISETDARTPESLAQVVIGPATAAEIGWEK